MDIKYLLDSNIIIDYLAGNFPKEATTFLDKIIDSIPIISVITKIEILGYNSFDEESLLLSDFIQSCSILELSNEIVDTTIQLRKSHKIRIPDAIIAATSIDQKRILLTRNVSDFKNIHNLEIVNPWDI